MVTLKFPKLEKVLMKGLKDVERDDPRLGIHVLSKTAIVYTNTFCLMVDLEDYFMYDCNITGEEEIEEIEKILFFMEGKTFNKEFWEELTKGANMKMRNGSLFIQNPKYSKDLHYDSEIDSDLLYPLREIFGAVKQRKGPVEEVALPFFALKSIYDSLASDFKHDYIIFENHSSDRPVKFTFKNRKHFYGYIHPDYDAAMESFKFEYFNTFDSTDNRDMLAEAESKLAPPPPKNIKQETINSDQHDMFGGQISDHYED